MVLLLSGNQWSSSWRATTTVSRLFLLLLLVHSIHAWSAHPRSCGGLPKHVHLAVGADPSTQMTVSFASIPSQYDGKRMKERERVGSYRIESCLSLTHALFVLQLPSVASGLAHRPRN